MTKKKAKSGGGAAAGPSNKNFKAGDIHRDENLGDENMEAANHNESGVKSEGDSQDEHERRLKDDEEDQTPRKVEIGEVGSKGQAVNGHPCMEGTVLELAPNEIDKMRAAGVPLLDVEDDDDRDVYDVSEPYVSPETDDKAA